MKLFCLVLLNLLLTSGICYPAELNNCSETSIENNKSPFLLETLFYQEIETLQESSTFHEPKTFKRTSTLQETKTFQDSVIIRLADNRLIIENLPNNGILEIYNIMGVKVYNRRVNAGTNEYVLHLPKGYYILKIGKLTKKIAIR